MKKSINEEIARMRILAGVKSTPETLNEEENRLITEGILANIAAGLGLALATFTGALGQNNVEKLKYSQDKKETIEKAMEDPEVQAKLKELGVEDNNIDRQIKQLKGKRITGYATRTATSDKELQRFLKLGYHLTAVDRDTVITKMAEATPAKNVESIQLKMDEETMFASGKFHLNEIDVQNIKTVLDSIQESGSVLVGVTIISSTDKQPVHPRLKAILKSLGYSPDNKGLSEARNNGVATAISSLGVDSSIVDKEVLFEQGNEIIDQNARYVVAIFDVIHTETPPAPEVFPTKEVKTFYNLIKPRVKRHKGIHLGGFCKIPVGHYSPKHSAVKCFFPAPK
jgi:hypothetical protein